MARKKSTDELAPITGAKVTETKSLAGRLDECERRLFRLERLLNLREKSNG